MPTSALTSIPKYWPYYNLIKNENGTLDIVKDDKLNIYSVYILFEFDH